MVARILREKRRGMPDKAGGNAKKQRKLMNGDTPKPSPERAREYWRKNLRCVLILLGIWFFVSFGCSILLADALDRVRIPGTGFKVGFWFSQQGSIYVFVLLIAFYVRYMNRLDDKLTGQNSGG